MHMQDYEVGDVDALERNMDGVNWHVFCMKEVEYVDNLMWKYHLESVVFCCFGCIGCLFW